MKNNFKLRLAALLLCLVMIFSASCAAADPTPSTTNPTTATTKGTTPKPTEPEADEPTEPEADEPTFPENGTEKIVSETINLYFTADDHKDILASHYEECPEILLMDTETICKEFLEGVVGKKGHVFTHSETDTTLTITRNNGAYCIIDFVEDTMYFNDFDLFTAYGFGNMADMLDYKHIDDEGNSFYFKRTDSVSIAGLPVRIDLAARSIPLDIYEGKKYIPFQTFNDIFLTPLYFNFAYNSKDLFQVIGESVDPSLTDEYYSIEPTERSEYLINYTTSELCLFLDLFYGLQDEHGVSYGFETFFKHTGLWEDLNSPNAAKSGAAVASLTLGYLADKHSTFSMPSAYTGSSKLREPVKYEKSLLRFFDYYDDISSARKEILGENVPGYYEKGNTAYITFDSFTFNEDRAKGYGENATDQSDTVGLIIYAHSQITREGSPIENVVLDLSCNGGGAADAAVYVVAWMLGYCDLHITNPITGSYATASYKVDVNLDGEFDDKDTIANKNLFCITSAYSFSCGNLVPALLKESNKVTILGDTSGGGACSVQFASMADGSTFRISSSHHITVVSNGAYYTIDRGIEPHYYFGKFESYFNRDSLTEFINNLK